jgi:predicted glycosyltransferase
LAGLELPRRLVQRVEFVGFLHREVPHGVMPSRTLEGDYMLVTTGGGGDGSDLVHNVLDAYRHDKELTHKALIVLGPFMSAKQRQKLAKKCKQIPYVEVIEFDSHLEVLMNGARAVVSMGGYNTFCEILSFDKPALIVPRTAPREEQLIRARRASELGLIDMLLPQQAEDPALLAAALKKLPHRLPPSKSAPGFVMDGLDNIIELVGGWLEQRAPRRFAVIDGSS